MSDLRNEIPKRAYLNAEIVQEVMNTPAFDKCLQVVKQKYGLLDYQFMNQAYITSLLYCLLVVPKEVWLKTYPDHPVYSEIEKRNLASCFVLEIPTDNNDKFFQSPIFSLIRGLRNSIAHARFAVDQDMKFTFWDQHNDSAPQHFRVSISIDNLSLFLSEVGALLANLS